MYSALSTSSTLKASRNFTQLGPCGNDRLSLVTKVGEIKVTDTISDTRVWKLTELILSLGRGASWVGGGGGSMEDRLRKSTTRNAYFG